MAGLRTHKNPDIEKVWYTYCQEVDLEPRLFLSENDRYMLFALSEEDNIPEREELTKIIKAEYMKRQYKELQNHG